MLNPESVDKMRIEALADRIYDDMDKGVFWEKALNENDQDKEKRTHVNRHIEKTPTNLIQRGLTDPTLTKCGPDKFVASTFSNAETARTLLEQSLTTMLIHDPEAFCILAESDEGTTMALWVAINPEEWEEFDVLQPCIVMDGKGCLSEIETNAFRMVFRKDLQAPYGFYIHTAFPDPYVKQASLTGDDDNPVKIITRPTGRNLKTDVTKTLCYRAAGPVRQAFLRNAANSYRPQSIKDVFYDPGNARYNPSIGVVFSPQSDSGHCFARINEQRTTISIDPGHGKKIKRLDLGIFEDWDHLHKVNDQAARYIDGIGKDLQSSTGLPRKRNPRQAKLSKLAINQSTKDRRANPPR